MAVVPGCLALTVAPAECQVRAWSNPTGQRPASQTGDEEDGRGEL
jgi:hypothetical protein